MKNFHEFKAVMESYVQMKTEQSDILDEDQKLFMFKTKAEADKKAKEVKGKVVALTKQNFAVIVEKLDDEISSHD